MEKVIIKKNNDIEKRMIHVNKYRYYKTKMNIFMKTINFTMIKSVISKYYKPNRDRFS